MNLFCGVAPTTADLVENRQSRGSAQAFIFRVASDLAFADVTGGYFSVGDERPHVPVAPGADRLAQRAQWQATAEEVAGFSRDERQETLWRLQISGERQLSTKQRAA